MTRARTLVRLAALTAGISIASLVLAAEPASAHGLGGVQPTNYQTRLVRVTPPVPGVRLRVVDLGTKLELTNDTAHDVTVLGYDGEPYLRVGPRGVFENTRSPATSINRSFSLTTAPPKSADPSAPPRWHQVSTSHTARWHDHRAHYMGSQPPPQVQRDPGRRHVFDHWTVTMLHQGRTITAAGELAWVPPPSPWPYVASAVGLAVVVFLACRSRRWAVIMAGSLVVVMVADIVHVVGMWDASTASSVTKLLESGYSIGGVILGGLALAWMVRRGAEAAMPLMLVAAIVLVIAGGLADITSLGHSEIPTTLAPGVARLLITVTLGVGTGVAAAAAIRLRRPPVKRAPTRAPQATRTTVTS